MYADRTIIEEHPGKAEGMAMDVLRLFEGMPVEDMKTVLSGLTIALLSYVMTAKKRYITVGDKDGLEKMILRWISGLDPVSGLHFSPYIKQEDL